MQILTSFEGSIQPLDFCNQYLIIFCGVGSDSLLDKI